MDNKNSINSGLICYLTDAANNAITILTSMGMDRDLAIEMLDVAVKNNQLKEEEIYILLDEHKKLEYGTI